MINEIYFRLKPQLPTVRYKVGVCPHCFTTLKITEDLWEYDNLTCLQCGNTMPSDVKEEERLQKIGRGFQKAAMFNDVSKLIFWICFLALNSMVYVELLKQCGFENKKEYDYICINEFFQDESYCKAVQKIG